MVKRKICFVTGTRAEFGLLCWLIKSVENDASLELQLIVTGMHLSPEFGMTIKAIEEDGIPISRKIEVLMSSDSAIGLSKSMGLGMISFAEAYEQMSPDLVVVLGDRFEIFAAVSAAMIACIPVGHIHGGEATEGLIDEPIRHSITKMSHLHFTTTDIYRKRVIQLGESPDRVFNTGAPGLDNLERLDLLSKSDFEESIDFKIGSKCAIVTFHPVTLENSTSASQFGALLKALDAFQEMNVIFTKPNADTDGRIIVTMMDDYVRKNQERACAFISLGQLRYLSALQYVDVVIGNSSSGIIEVPSFKIPTVDIGDRQKGRIKASSVVHCQATVEDITKSITKALSDEFLENVEDTQNPYGKAGASERIKKIIKEFPLEGIVQKKFHDL